MARIRVAGARAGGPSTFRVRAGYDPAVTRKIRSHRLAGNALLATALLVSLPVCFRALGSETRLSMLERAEAEFADTGDGATLQTALSEDADCGKRCSPRRLLLRAIGYGRLAAAATEGPTRQRDVATADGLALFALAKRREWGEASAVHAQIASLDPRRGDEALAAFRASYRITPYLRDASLWRLQFGAAHWGMLDPATRDAVMAEAVWLAGISQGDQEAAQAALGDSPAGLRFALLVTRLRIAETR